eukprot:3574159-Amphidinium_carterae.1
MMSKRSSLKSKDMHDMTGIRPLSSPSDTASTQAVGTDGSSKYVVPSYSHVPLLSGAQNALAQKLKIYAKLWIRE